MRFVLRGLLGGVRRGHVEAGTKQNARRSLTWTIVNNIARRRIIRANGAPEVGIHLWLCLVV